MREKHWTEEELVAHLYGVGPNDGHIDSCIECAGQVSKMQNARRSAEASHDPGNQVSTEFLNAQRRTIYQRLSQPVNFGRVWRLAPALAASLVIAGGLFLYDHQAANQQTPNTTSSIVMASDTQLVEDVGGLAMNPEPAPVAPLQALFEE